MAKVWWVAVLGAGVTLLCVGWWLGRGPAVPANVVFILVDTVRCDRIGAERNGVPVAPFLEELAEQSVYFPRAVSPSSWTKPAMASLFTSAYVDAHQVYFSARNEDLEHPTSDILPGVFETMAEYLSRHGYDTWAFQTNANLLPGLGFAQGFGPGRYVFANGARADAVTSQAVEVLPSMKPPFFMYLHFMDPHAPYEPPASSAALFGPEPPVGAEEGAVIAPDRFVDYIVRRTALLQENGQASEAAGLSSAARMAVEQRYDAEIRFVDDQLGDFVRRVRRMYPKTLFVIVSDHGEEFWEHGGVGHGSTLYEEQIRVPLLFCGPGLTPRQTPAPVETLGILPSIAAYLGLPGNPSWQGMNLLSEEALGVRPAFSRTLGSWEETRVDLESVLHGHQKLIVDKKRAEKAFFDLRGDPGEQQNLGKNGESWQFEEQWLVPHRAANERRQAPRGIGTAVQIDDETRQQLESIGYLGERGEASGPAAP